MRDIYTALLDIDLQLFSDGAAGDTAAGGTAVSTGDGATQGDAGALPKADTRRSGSSRRGKTGEYENVVFGKQGDASAAGTGSDAGSEGEGNAARKSGVTTTSDTLEAKRKAFEELINGEYKDQYTEKFQQAFNRRFKDVKGMEDTIAAQKPILDMLMQKYKIADGDVAKLQKAIEQDSTYWEKAAEEAGLTVEQYREMQKLERENAELKRIQQRQQADQQAQRQVSQWVQEAEKVKEQYPSFNLQAECQSRDFMGLLKSGVPVQKAYELMHMEEIMAAKEKAAANTASAQMTASIKAKASRPSENGTSRQSAVIVKSSVSDLSRADRAEIARRVQRGEKISF